MMASRIKAVIIFAIVVAGATFGYFKVYEWPRRDIDDGIQAFRASIQAHEQRIDETRGTTERLRRVAATTLGDTHAEVEARFRSRLGEIARAGGLQEVVANSGRPLAAVNPGGSSSPRVPGEFGRMLGRGIDFYVVEGSLSGVGSLDQALTVLATVQAQAWVHRIGAVTIRPLGNEREQFELRLDGIATLLMPDLVDPEAPAPEWVALQRDDAQRWAPIVEKNIFRVPAVEAPPPPPAPKQDPPKPPPPAPPPYADWRLTGLPGGTSGMVAAMSNVRTGESRLLEVGATVLDAQLIEIGRFSAIFQIGGIRFEVLMGQTLAERREIP